MRITPEFKIPETVTAGRKGEKSSASRGDFAGFLQNSLREVNELQLNAEKLDRQLAAGTLENVHEATIAAEKAALALELTVQVRNKIIEAYQEIMRMPV